MGGSFKSSPSRSPAPTDSGSGCPAHTSSGTTTIPIPNPTALWSAAPVERMSAEPPGRSPIHDGLKLAIWSDRDKVDPAVVNKLRPILGKYF